MLITYLRITIDIWPSAPEGRIPSKCQMGGSFTLVFLIRLGGNIHWGESSGKLKHINIKYYYIDNYVPRGNRCREMTLRTPLWVRDDLTVFQVDHQSRPGLRSECCLLFSRCDDPGPSGNQADFSRRVPASVCFKQLYFPHIICAILCEEHSSDNSVQMDRRQWRGWGEERESSHRSGVCVFPTKDVPPQLCLFEAAPVWSSEQMVLPRQAHSCVFLAREQCLNSIQKFCEICFLLPFHEFYLVIFFNHKESGDHIEKNVGKGKLFVS